LGLASTEVLGRTWVRPGRMGDNFLVADG
jgi:hypothetical protein